MRIAQAFSGEAQGTSMAGDKSEIALHQALVDRFQSLEASHERLREQFDELVQESNKIIKNKEVDDDMVGSYSDSRWGCFPGFFGAGGPYRSVLEHMGHAVHVCTASSGEIIYWYVCIYVCMYEFLYAKRFHESLSFVDHVWLWVYCCGFDGTVM